MSYRIASPVHFFSYWFLNVQGRREEGREICKFCLVAVDGADQAGASLLHRFCGVIKLRTICYSSSFFLFIFLFHCVMDYPVVVFFLRNYFFKGQPVYASVASIAYAASHSSIYFCCEWCQLRKLDIAESFPLTQKKTRKKNSPITFSVSPFLSL